MAATESSGTQTTVANTDHTLAAPTSAKTRILILDLVNLAATATIDVTIRMSVLNGGVVRVAYKANFTGAAVLDEPVVPSIPVPMVNGGDFIINCSAAINIPWAIVTLD